MVVGWIGSSTDDIQLSSFSCSPPPNSSSSCSSSSSSKPGTRWSLARVPSAIDCAGGRASSSWRLWTCLGRGTLSCPVSGPERFKSVCVDLSTVAARELDFDGTELPFTLWPFTLVTVLSDSWLEIVKKTEINTKESYQQTPQTQPAHKYALNVESNITIALRQTQM